MKWRRNDLDSIPELARLILHRQTRVRTDMALSGAEDLIAVLLGLGAPLLLKTLVDDLTSGPKVGGAPAIIVIVFVVSWSGAGVLSTIKPLHSTRIVAGLYGALRTRVLRAQLPIQARGQGEDASKVLGLLERTPFHLQVIVDGLLGRAAPLVVQLAAALVLIGFLAPLHDSIGLALTLLAYLFAGQIRMKAFAAQTKKLTAMTSHVSRGLADVVRNAPRVVFNANVEAELSTLDDYGRAKTAVDLKLSWHLSEMGVAQYAVLAIGLSLLLGLSAQDVLAHRATVGDFVLLQAFALRLATPLTGLGFLLRQAQVSLASLQEVLALAAPPNADMVQIPLENGASIPIEITLDRIDFTYERSQVALKGISADIPPGALVALVGPNGSGKSTLAKIIAGALSPTAGRVLLSGVDITGIAETARYQRVLYVPQFIGLFNRSLRENGCYPPSMLNDHELLACLKDWNFQPDKQEIDLTREVGDQGAKLSGGQIQKLELARLTGVDKGLVVLDESTSALDQLSEQGIIGRLRNKLTNTTIVLVTHRPALAEQADLVLFLEAGTLSASGSHIDLLAANASYRKFWAVSSNPQDIRN